MTFVFVVLAVILIVGLALGAYAWLAPRPAQVQMPPAPPQLEPWHATTEWTTQAGDEFAGLTESARCDLIFAVADLNDERSHQLLLHALDDPSDAVALAAAHALARRGSGETVNDYAQSHPGERAQRILQTLALLQ
jgi:HEAT repeat protein